MFEKLKKKAFVAFISIYISSNIIFNKRNKELLVAVKLDIINFFLISFKSLFTIIPTGKELFEHARILSNSNTASI
jgi:hypothetical protein